jgi:hypothetical protein
MEFSERNETRISCVAGNLDKRMHCRPSCEVHISCRRETLSSDCILAVRFLRLSFFSNNASVKSVYIYCTTQIYDSYKISFDLGSTLPPIHWISCLKRPESKADHLLLANDAFLPVTITELLKLKVI